MSEIVGTDICDTGLQIMWAKTHGDINISQLNIQRTVHIFVQVSHYQFT